MRLVIAPPIALRPYVACLWMGERSAAAGREQVLPNSAMHIAVRLQGGAVRLHGDGASSAARVAGEALVAGARDACYWKDASVATRTLGAQLRPGAARALFGVSAAEFAGRHVTLEAAWGRDAARLREALHDAAGPRGQFAALAAALAARLRSPRAMHPAVAHALARMQASPDSGRLPEIAGISQRHFIAQFRDATGLSPKRYARVLRFRLLLRHMAAAPARPLAELALAAGYSDQSHCHRDFLAFAGVAPHAWRLRQGRHTALPAGPGGAGSVSSKTDVPVPRHTRAALPRRSP